MLCDVMISCKQLTHLDLQQATVILQGGGRTGTRLMQGVYAPPAAAAGGSPPRQGRQQQQQQQQKGRCGA